MRGEAWTEARVTLLKQLWAKGETAGAIGARLGGLSRSAVLGKIFRLRLPIADAEPTSPSPNNVARDGCHRAGRKAAKPASSTRPPKPSAIKNTPARRRGGIREDNALRGQSPATDGRRKTLLELTNDSCRWPHGNPGTARFFFCGAAGADVEAGMPYCPRHARRAYLTKPATIVKARRLASRAA